ncbi:MAG: hypothetical protein ACRDRL_24985 [Sciscionella sp.]
MSKEKKTPPHRDPDEVETTNDPRFRRVTLRWVLEKPSDGVEIHAVLSVMYSRGHGYRATLRNGTVNTTGELRTEQYWAMVHEAFIVQDIPARRFSKNGMQAAQVTALAVLRRRADEPVVAVFFDPHNENRWV